MDKTNFFYGTGRRKTSVARVRLFENGTGVFDINGKDINEYFGLDTLKLIAKRPLEKVGISLNSVDVRVNVSGGGVTGQAGAISHGLARALEKLDAENRAKLKPAGLLTRDSRMKERKKYGLKAARRAPQFSKR
jgi:small subunit ribosomal protein S9